MNPRQPVVSGQRLIKALRKDGWEVVRQRGSHVRLKKAGHRHALVVPLHKEIRRGTLAAILRDADLTGDDLTAVARVKAGN
ncbi:MAG TPA: type II toxin-antitoxin system HicA family toxin [Solirubrobacterales bacterium]|nr:type II toxin-antitoxin system HicA family toxin [Solirubrobacterales bacterium]